MTILRKFLLLACGFLLLAAPAWSQEASDLFLRAYQDFQAGEKLERDGSPREAFARYQSAAKLLEQIVKAQPDWQPSVIEYRLKKTRENITRLEGEVAALPAVQEGPEGPLPQPDVPLPPPVINTSQPLIPRPPANGTRQPVPTATPRPTQVPTSESAALRQQLAAARAENERLQDKLSRQSAEVRSKLVEIDKIKVTVVELKAQLAQAQDAMETAAKDREVPKAVQVDDKRVAELTDRIQGAEADNEALIEENQRLLAKLESASKYIESADSGRKVLEEDRKKIAKQRDEVIARTKRIKDNTAALEKLTQEKEDLQARFAKEKKELEDKLAKATDSEKLDRLAAENKDLAARLAETEKKLADAAAKPAENDKVLTDLRSEINSLNDRLLESQAQIATRDDQLKALAKQLDESSGEAARLKLNPQPTDDEKRTMVENDLLRGIILRQIKEQAERDAARNGLEKEIQTLQVKSDTISSQLAILSRPAFQLTDDERLLFKEPIAALSEPDSSSLNVSMVVAKPADGFPAPTAAEGPESLPDATRDMVDQARKLFEQGRFGDAEKLYQQIVDSAPNNYFALSNLGVTQIQVRKLSAAEVALKKAIEINPKDAFAATNRGIVYCKQGRFDDAVAALKEAIISDDKDYIAQNYLGICYGEKGLKGKAEEAFKRSIEIRDDYADAHFNLAVLYATTEPPSLDLAREHYKKAVALGSTADPSLEKLLDLPGAP
ncbi:MAG: tetratricopeptide repeat protein [Verrucomicrobia bacterium]|nr:tetratricopeptide repeat protein [Verrucomicrobiota bacterium]